MQRKQNGNKTETKWKQIGGVDCLAGQGNIIDALSPASATATETYI
jgi:hypothetical protein